MPQIILGPGLKKLDGSLHKATFNFLAKLGDNDTTPGLHIEPMQQPRDERARTGRVTDKHRAVLFKLQGSNEDASYVFIGTYPHDEAITIARSSSFAINPRNGIAELIPVSENATPAADTAPDAAAAIEPPTLPAADNEDDAASAAEDTDDVAGAAAPGAEVTGTTVAPAPTEPISPEDEPATLRDRGFVAAHLTDLGIDSAFAEGALDIAGADAVLDYADLAPATWQASALLDIVTGESLATVREKYHLDADEPAGDSSDDDTLIKAMRHPAARMEFAFIDGRDELEAAIDNPDFSAWRIFLHPEQRAFVTRDYRGPARVSGGAGTGKTVVLIHRARRLARAAPGAKIVLTTFNRTLADTLRIQLHQLDPSLTVAEHLGDPGIYIGGIDSIAYQILQRADDLGGTDDARGPVADVLGRPTTRVLPPTGSDEWGAVAAEATDELPAALRTASFLRSEYENVVIPHRITTEREYLKVRRAGRGVPLGRRQRRAAWRAFESYRASATAAGTTDFEEKAAIAAGVLARDGASADHVLVDEAQDLSPTRFQLLRALVADGPNDLFIAEDMHQRIYGRKVVLGHYGITIRGRSRRLTLNYRTTEENLRFALGILEGVAYTDLDDEPESTDGYRSARSGPTPVLAPAASEGQQYDLVADQIRRWQDAHPDADAAAIGLLAPTRKECEKLSQALGQRGVPVTFVTRDVPAHANKPLVMTMHRAKGMEFAQAVLVGVDRAAMPRRYAIDSEPDEDRTDALQRERSLLYVAATRARDELMVTWVGTKSALLPAEDRKAASPGPDPSTERRFGGDLAFAGGLPVSGRPSEQARPMCRPGHALPRPHPRRRDSR